MWDLFQGFLGILLILCSLFMILLILVQRGRGGGLTGALGGAGGQSAFGSKAGDAFTRITIGTAVVWIFLSMITISVFNRPVRPVSPEDDVTSLESLDAGEGAGDATERDSGENAPGVTDEDESTAPKTENPATPPDSSKENVTPLPGDPTLNPPTTPEKLDSKAAEPSDNSNPAADSAPDEPKKDDGSGGGS